METQTRKYEIKRKKFLSAAIFIGNILFVSGQSPSAGWVPERMRSTVGAFSQDSAGYQYNVNGFFHFFVQNRFVLGNHVYFDVKNLGEYRFSAGLGFHLNVLR